MDDYVEMDRKILSASLACLDADVIDWSNLASVEEESYVVAANLVSAAGSDIEEYRAFFNSYLLNGNSEVLDVMISITNVDWAFNDETLKVFKKIISKISSGIEFYTNRSAT